MIGRPHWLSFQPKEASAKSKSNDILKDSETQCLLGFQLAKVTQWIRKGQEPNCRGGGDDTVIWVWVRQVKREMEEKQKRLEKGRD